MAESSGRLLPQVTERNEFFWTSGADGKLRFQRCTECGRAAPPAGPGVRLLPLDRVGTGRGVRARGRRRLHGQRAHVDPHVPAAVRDRDRRHRGGRPRPAHHQHRQLRPRRRARRDEGAGAVRARRRRVDTPVRAHRRPREGPVPRHRPQEPRRPADAEGSRQVRGQRRRHRHRHVAGRSPADGRPHHADGRRRHAGDRGRRPPSRRTSTACPRTPAPASGSACRRAVSTRSRRSCGCGRRGSTAASSCRARAVP